MTFTKQGYLNYKIKHLTEDQVLKTEKLIKMYYDKVIEECKYYGQVLKYSIIIKVIVIYNYC